MELHTFIVDSAQDAVQRIRDELGAEAVVVSVRKLPASGLGRLFKPSQIEVVAGVQVRAPHDPLAEIREELLSLKREIGQPRSAPDVPMAEPRTGAQAQRGSRIQRILEQAAFPPLLIEQMLDDLAAEQLASVQDELAAVRQWLRKRWPRAPEERSRTHIFVGPAGSGKSTVLCKWLAQTSLVGSEAAAVLQLDAHIANASPLPSLYAEIMGARFDRALYEIRPEETAFIDVPGFDWRDARAGEQVKAILAEVPDAQVHLVLNAAYDTQTLLAQARGFSVLSVGDIIFTHLDEDSRPGKLWAVLLGTNYSARFISAGQNVPGDFRPASGESLSRIEIGLK